MVRMESNPSGSRPNFFGRQHLTFDKGRAWMPEVERPKALHGRKANRAFIWQEYSAWQGIVRILKWVVWGEGQLAIIIQKRSQCSTVTALFINYCFV